MEEVVPRGCRREEAQMLDSSKGGELVPAVNDRGVCKKNSRFVRKSAETQQSSHAPIFASEIKDGRSSSKRLSERRDSNAGQSRRRRVRSCS